MRPTTPNTVMYDEEEVPKKSKSSMRSDLAPPAPVYVAPVSDISGKGSRKGLNGHFLSHSFHS